MDYSNNGGIAYFVPKSEEERAVGFVGFVTLAQDPASAYEQVLCSKGARCIELGGSGNAQGRYVMVPEINKENIDSSVVPLAQIRADLPADGLVGVIRNPRIGHRIAAVSVIEKVLF